MSDDDVLQLKSRASTDCNTICHTFSGGRNWQLATLRTVIKHLEYYSTSRFYVIWPVETIYNNDFLKINLPTRGLCNKHVFILTPECLMHVFLWSIISLIYFTNGSSLKYLHPKWMHIEVIKKKKNLLVLIKVVPYLYRCLIGRTLRLLSKQNIFCTIGK